MVENYNAVDLEELSDNELDKVSGGVMPRSAYKYWITCGNPACRVEQGLTYDPSGQTVTCPKCGFEMFITPDMIPPAS